jgi:uncharacterized protein with FMN-binding domain
MKRPALATAGTVLGILLLLGGKSITTPNEMAGIAGSSTLAPTSEGSVAGPVVTTPYGPVQVQVDVVAGRIADIKAIQLPAGGTSGSIADYAAPILRREALAAQGAGIQAVSGATYTSQGYATSLQAALDQLAATKASAASFSGSGADGRGRHA